MKEGLGKVILILLIFVLVMVHYYLTSPYEICKRNEFYGGGDAAEQRCFMIVTEKKG
jgi:hypothetical protein